MSVHSEGRDPFKPPLPYIPGTVLNVKKHVPPAPIGIHYNHSGPPGRFDIDDGIEEECDDLRQLPKEFYKHASTYCLRKPPPTTPPHPDSKVYRLTITDQIACRDGRGSQVVLCKLQDGKERLVAKIFDPLYYNWSGGKSDITYYADSQYSSEAAAYMELVRTGHDGQVTPKYRGSWTFEATLLNGSRRDVRMVLMDHVPYPSMESLMMSGKVDQIPGELRIEVAARARENCAWLHFWGVRQNDLMPRNILVDIRGKACDVKIIDFSISHILDFPTSRRKRHPDSVRSRPRNPGVAFVMSCGIFRDWMPKQMHSKEVRLQWIKKRWRNNPNFEPIPEEDLRLTPPNSQTSDSAGDASTST